MTVNDWLQTAVEQLAAAGIETARLDALILLSDQTGHDRGYILAHLEATLSSRYVAKLNNLLNLRATHMPLSYLRGWVEFYGREFKVDSGVLVPRPESETIIELFNDLAERLHVRGQIPPNGKTWRVADIGTGSGALGITAALEQPSMQITLMDIDDRALEIARVNVINLSTTVTVIKSDLLRAAPHSYDILLCNLPYVPDGHVINQAAQHEPSLAIFGGADGLDVYRQLFCQINNVANKPLYILTEAFPKTHKILAKIAGQSSYKLVTTNDFIQLFQYQSVTIDECTGI